MTAEEIRARIVMLLGLGVSPGEVAEAVAAWVRDVESDLAAARRVIADQQGECNRLLEENRKLRSRCPGNVGTPEARLQCARAAGHEGPHASPAPEDGHTMTVTEKVERLIHARRSATRSASLFLVVFSASKSRTENAVTAEFRYGAAGAHGEITERRTLEAVLNILDDKETSHEP